MFEKLHVSRVSTCNGRVMCCVVCTALPTAGEVLHSFSMPTVCGECMMRVCIGNVCVHMATLLPNCCLSIRVGQVSGG